MKKLALIFLLVFLGNCLFGQSKKLKTAVLNVITTQQKEWNNGNLEGFMKYYWNNDSLVFISQSGLKYGWTTVLKNYQRFFPNKATMGTLTFKDVFVPAASKNVATLSGKWMLDYPEGSDREHNEGRFTLILRKIAGKWLIVYDHTIGG